MSFFVLACGIGEIIHCEWRRPRRCRPTTWLHVIIGDLGEVLVIIITWAYTQRRRFRGVRTYTTIAVNWCYCSREDNKHVYRVTQKKLQQYIRPMHGQRCTEKTSQQHTRWHKKNLQLALIYTRKKIDTFGERTLRPPRLKRWWWWWWWRRRRWWHRVNAREDSAPAYRLRESSLFVIHHHCLPPIEPRRKHKI